MTTGLEVYNTEGKLIASTNFINYGLKRVIDVTLLPSEKITWTGISSSFYVLTVQGTAPLIFFSFQASATMKAAIIFTEYANGTWKYYIATNGLIKANSTYIYAFDLMQTLLPSGSPHGVGLECFDTSGKLTFSTNLYSLKIKKVSLLPNDGMIGGESAVYAGSGGTNGYSSGGAYAPVWNITKPENSKKYAIGLSKFRYGASSSSTEYDYGDAYHDYLFENSSGVIQVSFDFCGLSGEGFGGFLGTGSDAITNMPQAFLIDITNFPLSYSI